MFGESDNVCVDVGAAEFEEGCHSQNITAVENEFKLRNVINFKIGVQNCYNLRQPNLT